MLADVRRVEVRADRLATDALAGGYRSTFRGRGVEFSDVREYVEGDDPRDVDWNVTARSGRPFVKRFVEERERTLLLVFDLGPTMTLGLGCWSSRQALARFAALLGRCAIDNRDRVGLVAGGGTSRRLVLPQAGGGHVLRVLRECVEAPEQPCGDLPGLLALATARVRRRAVVFVLSDFQQPGYERALAICARHHDVVAVRALPLELIDPPRGLLRVAVPGRAPQLLDLADVRVRAWWAAGVHRWRVRHDDAIGRAGITGIDVELPATRDVSAVSGPLLRFFRRRARRGSSQ